MTFTNAVIRTSDTDCRCPQTISKYIAAETLRVLKSHAVSLVQSIVGGNVHKLHLHARAVRLRNWFPERVEDPDLVRVQRCTVGP